MRWAGHVALIGERRSVYGVLVGKPKGKRYLKDPGLDGMIILKWIIQEMGSWDIDWIDLAQDRES